MRQPVPAGALVLRHDYDLVLVLEDTTRHGCPWLLIVDDYSTEGKREGKILPLTLNLHVDVGETIVGYLDHAMVTEWWAAYRVNIPPFNGQSAAWAVKNKNVVDAAEENGSPYTLVKPGATRAEIDAAIKQLGDVIQSRVDMNCEVKLTFARLANHPPVYSVTASSL